MREKVITSLHQLIERRNRQFIQEVRGEEPIDSIVEKKVNMHKARGAEIVRSFVEGDVVRTSTFENQQYIDYRQRTEFLIRIKDQFYIEEELESRRAVFVNEELVNDMKCEPKEVEREAVMEGNINTIDNSREIRSYNRREAVRYAERWWDDYNPAYRKFTNNCTNFISQCLHAGGASMTGHPNRSKGWWFRSDNWSFSWSVANAMRWYLSGAQSGLRGEEKEHASDLEPGDVICYDFDGDGTWQHTTIVVAKDANNEPLVNAQTANSRMRYWKYEDSTAYTPNIKYKFFHIVV
ncbi:amidase domain-containing protein [Halalkalibacter kiskunsagensis]|uniref:Amidase domain-containing protein n=1 Tax=Halalkalibacter kiskunsagensis TaxID=1548599 RepID=A0ABV6KC67_9BACI